jgi:hypothetical protein
MFGIRRGLSGGLPRERFSPWLRVVQHLPAVVARHYVCAVRQVSDNP